MVFDERNLDKSKLPTKRDVMQYLLFLRNETLRQGATRTSSYDEFCAPVAVEIEALWQRSKIPTVLNTSIQNKIKFRIVKIYRDIMKNPSHYVEDDWNKLFMISQCRCGIESNLRCQCTASFRIPKEAKRFSIDQCNERLLTLDEWRN